MNFFKRKPENKTSLEPADGPGYGDLRISENHYQDGSVRYKAEVFEYGAISHNLNWRSVDPLCFDGNGTLQEAKDQIDVFLKNRAATTVVSTTFIKYP